VRVGDGQETADVGIVVPQDSLAKRKNIHRASTAGIYSQ
jgi:hypothetical protein